MTHLESFDAGLARTSRMAFSQAVRAGGLVFVSGQPATDTAGRVVGDDLESQARQAFRNLQTVLHDAGTSLAHVTHFSTMLRDITELATLVRVRQEFVRAPYPADTVFQPAALARPDFLVEVNAIAVMPDAPDADHRR